MENIFVTIALLVNGFCYFLLHLLEDAVLVLLLALRAAAAAGARAGAALLTVGQGDGVLNQVTSGIILRYPCR